MIKKHYFILLLLFSLMNVLVISELAATEILEPGIYKNETIFEHGLVLRYGLFIPDKIADYESIPLIIALHYGGRVTPYYGLEYMNTLVLPALGNAGAIIVAPDCPFQNWKSDISENAVLNLIEHLKNNYAIDKRRIAVTGFSMGGRGAWHMAARHPHIFSAAVIVAGMPDSLDLEKIETVPLYLIHSDADQILPLEPTREAYRILKRKKVPVRLRIINDISHYNTAGFIPELQRSRSWLRRIWKRAVK